MYVINITSVINVGTAAAMIYITGCQTHLTIPRIPFSLQFSRFSRQGLKLLGVARMLLCTPSSGQLGKEEGLFVHQRVSKATMVLLKVSLDANVKQIPLTIP